MVHSIIRIENGMAFALSFVLYVRMDYPLWLFFVLLLAPDLTMIGYAMNQKTGARMYNVGHSFILPFLFVVCYVFFSNDYLLIIAIIWIAHICMDRLFGFGLKYKDSFKSTHIQKI
ncbi:hypothetical protein A374_00290 [Fictibacillus macauensis ZFHKF-1]|uniref:DUF4260 domain-containing protein n=1 Tax=Fictibacillus macauensis ZFHKF-1 TaxID=1196324 RepID=I8J6C5_9BACL|nr:DUF4260 domain-containing protein [Fictibacillus macauensis]EIT87366.1 hypothetical protein A374_00290 [Fictibacillus macauensis ZFHKF-1]